MSNVPENDSAAKEWTPPPRPEWVERINAEGRIMNARGVLPLDPQSLIDSAALTTGLSDFGADDWRPHFEVLVKSLDEEANLNFLGRLRTRSELLQLLEARLQIEDTYKRHPEIDNERIVKPLILIGQGRSGTSLLYNLVSEDPDNRALLTWECILPCPPPEWATYDTDPRIERAHQLITQWNRVTPTFEAHHEFSGRSPMECLMLKALNFAAPHWFMAFGQAPTYNNYAAGIDMGPTYRYYRRVLKLLQWKNPRRRWALKSMSHLDYLPELMQVFPDACLIWSHRDPVRAMRSTESFLLTYNWSRSDDYALKPSLMGHFKEDVTAGRLTRPIDWIESGVVPKHQLCNVQYNDLIADPVGTVESVYRYFALPFTSQARAALERYMQVNPREARPPHRYAMGSEEAVARVRRAFKRYQDYFHVPNE